MVQGLSMFARQGAGIPPRYRTPAVVLVHGQVISSLYMVPTARLLAPAFPVLAPDLPGFGLSGKPRRVLDIRGLADMLGAWMDAVGLRSAALVANSLGCQIVVDLAVRRPELAAALVLAAPTIDRHARNAGIQIVRWLKDVPYERPSLALVHLRDFALAGPHRALQTFRFTLADRIEEKLPRIQAPTLVVRGERDPIVPQRWAEEVTRLLPRGRLVVIPRGPHCVNYSSAESFARVVADFLRPPGADLEATSSLSETSR
jgi:pimeloyl-ACP methyl ester carboxylesterase